MKLSYLHEVITALSKLNAEESDVLSVSLETGHTIELIDGEPGYYIQGISKEQGHGAQLLTAAKIVQFMTLDLDGKELVLFTDCLNQLPSEEVKNNYQYNADSLGINPNFCGLQEFCNSLHWAIKSTKYTVWEIAEGDVLALNSAINPKYLGTYTGGHGPIHLYQDATGTYHATCEQVNR